MEEATPHLLMASVSPSRNILHDLPQDVLLQILSKLDPRTLLTAVAPASSYLRNASVDDAVWEQLFALRYASLITALFDGNVPPPPPSTTSWMVHYFSFATRNVFLRRCRDDCQKLCMVINGLVIDATSYLHQHPGEPEVLLAAAGHDATEVFAEVGHSARAHKMLESLSVGACAQLLPQDGGLPALLLPLSAARTTRVEAAAEAIMDSGSSLPPSAPSASLRESLGRLVHRLRNPEERGRLLQWLSLMSSAVVRDLTEGRPDCRRLAPALWKLSQS